MYEVLPRFTGYHREFGIEKSQIEDFLTRRGFTYVVGVNTEQIKRLYCMNHNKRRTMAENYAIVYKHFSLMNHI